MRINLKINDIGKYIYIFFLGFFGFSVLGQHVVLNILRMPFSFMEIYYIPLIFLYRKRLFVSLKKTFFAPSKIMIFFLGLMAFGMCIGTILTFDPSIIINYRSFIYILIIICYVKKYGISISVSQIFWVNFFAMLGDFIYINFITTAGITSSVNCVAIAVSILTSFVCEKYLWGSIACVFGILLGITSGFRIGIVISVICLIEAIVYTLIRWDRRSKPEVLIKRMLVTGIFIGGLFALIIYYEPLIGFIANKLGMSAFAIFRVTERMKGLLKLDFSTSQDTVRMKIFMYPIQRFFINILPRGLIGETIGEYSLYIDVPILYLYDLIGSIGAIIVIIYFGFMVLKKASIIFKRNTNHAAYAPTALQVISVLVSPILFILEIINGSFVVIVFQAIETAFILGVLLSKNIKKSI